MTDVLKIHFFTSAAAAIALSTSCKPRDYETQSQAFSSSISPSSLTRQAVKTINEAERQLTLCPFYLSYGYALERPDIYQAARTGLFPQTQDLLKTSIDIWHSTTDDLSSVASKCEINLPYTERISISYTERAKSSCVVEWMRMGAGNIIRIAALDGDSHNFNGVVSEKSKISFFQADSVKSRPQFFSWFVQNGALRCKSSGRWLTPLSRMKSALHSIAALPISYQHTTRARLEIWPENSRSPGGTMAREFLSVLRDVKQSKK